jgi:glycosyltransferase involved in cell wall biosynthesis
MKNEIGATVVIATRDRAASLARLLQCVQRQDLQTLECIVVDDGSTDETLDAYGKIWAGLDERFRLLLQEPNERRALGPSSARNRGIKAAQGEFVAFCDDDDLWIRDDHLSVAVNSLRAQGADLFFANMQTSRAGTILGPDFYGTVRQYFARRPLPDSDDLFEVSRQDRVLGMKHMFLHCNSLVVSGELLHRSGLFWEKLSMAEDRDLGLRLLDRAEKVLYRDVVVADYDRTTQVGICKAYTGDEIRQFVILAMLHAETSMQNHALRRVAKGYRAWMLLELAQSAHEAGRTDQAHELAWQSVMLRPTIAALGLLLRTGISPNGASPRRAKRHSGA